MSDLSPLKDMKLTQLDCGNTKVSDLSPLKDMKLTFLGCRGTQVSDLSPLKDMKLTTLDCDATQVSDLSPLKDMPLQRPMVRLQPLSGTPRSCAPSRRWTRINGKPAAEFWKEVDAQRAAFDAWLQTGRRDASRTSKWKRSRQS